MHIRHLVLPVVFVHADVITIDGNDNDRSSPDTTNDDPEWALDRDDIGRPANFLWAAYLDKGGSDPDDYCPHDADQPGYTPEPSTMVLLPITLAAVGLWRRAAEKKS